MTNWPWLDQSVCAGARRGLRPIPARQTLRRERPSVVIDALIDKKSDN
jgi:hypothetical protein